MYSILSAFSRPETENTSKRMVKGEFAIVGVEQEPTARRFVGSKLENFRHRFRSVIVIFGALAT